MATLQEIGTRFASHTIIYGSFNVLVNICVASGTRFISHIPTQAYTPAAMAGAIYTLICATYDELLHQFAAPHHISKYFLKSQKPDYNEKKEAFDKAITVFQIIQLAITTLTTVLITPIITKRLISNREAFAFAMVNNLSIVIFSAFLLLRKLEKQ